MDQIYNSFAEEDIESNLELCEVAIKKYVIYYLKEYYPKKFKEIEVLAEIPKFMVDKTSIMHIPDDIVEMRYNIGFKLFSAKIEIIDMIKPLPEINLEGSGLEFKDDAEKQLTINKSITDMMVMQRALSAMLVDVWNKISINWELPIDLALVLHSDGKIFLESNNSDSVFIKCRKAKKFLFVSIIPII